MPPTIDAKQITEQLYVKNLELLEQRKRTEELLYNISEIVLTIDKDYKIIFFNKTTQKVLDISSPKDILGKDINEVIKVKHGEKYFDIKTYAFGEPDKGHRIKNLILETPDKTKITYVNLSTFTLFYPTTKRMECLITITDITEEKMLGKMKDEFLSLAAHELRTPITIIKGYLWLIQQEKAGKLTKAQKAYIDTVMTSADNMHNLINDMLNISRIEQGKTLFKIEKVDICKELAANVEGLQIKAKERNSYIELESVKTCDYTAFADKTKLIEVFLNLVGNAIKFTKQGAIKVILEDTNDFVKVSVVDTGIGIAKDDQEKLFVKFGRIDSSYQTVAEIQGTGLGLYITKQYIEKMGGSIGMSSEGVGKGSTFWFTLPKNNLNKRK